MKLNEFVILNKLAASNEEIVMFEKENGLTIPDQYRDLLLVSNGAQVEGSIQNPLDERWKMIIYSELNSLNGLKDGILFIKSINQDGMRFQYQDKILKIGGTHDGPGIFLGHTKPIKGKIFIEDLDKLTKEGEISLHLVANSFNEFLSKIESFPEG